MLSVIIPCYNNGVYLRKMLDCFLTQTSDYWEIIIVDDGSSDDTPEIVKKYCETDSRIKFYNRDRQPKGSVVCRNIGFEKSSGKYICHLDADDLVSSTFVEHRVHYMETHPETDYASFCAKTFMNDKKLPSYEASVRTYGVGLNTEDLLQDFLTARYSFSVWNNIYRKSSIRDYSWDEKVKIYTDFSFIVPCIIKGLKHSFADIREVDYYYRVFSKKSKSINMCSNFISNDKCESTLYLFEKTINQIKTLPDSGLRMDQFFGFIILNYERLMKGRNQEQIQKYINFVSRFYSAEIVGKLVEINKSVNRISNSKIYDIKLHWLLIRKLKADRFKRDFKIELIKFILHRN